MAGIRFLCWISLLVALAFCFLGLSSYAFPHIWFTDNMSFFQRQFLGGAAAGIVFCAVMGTLIQLRSRLFWNCSFVLFLLVGMLAGLMALRTVSVASSSQPQTRAGVKFVSINIERLNLQDPVLTAFLEREKPDILLLQETFWWQQDRWLAEAGLAEIEGTGPYPQTLIRGRLGQTSVFSRFPVLNTEMIEVPATDLADRGSYREIVIVDLETPDGPVQLFAVHPNSPRTLSRWEDRQRYLAMLQDAILKRRQQSSAPIIVMGDWNTSPWSGQFASLLKRTGLTTTFPDGLPQTTRFFYDYRLHWFLGAVVDHIAVSSELVTGATTLGPDIGSDHLPLIATVHRKP